MLPVICGTSFDALEELYGISSLKLNRFAFLAATYGDRAVAARAFERIGPDWDPGVWGGHARFESQRNWAGLPGTPPAPVPVPLQVSQPPTRSAEVEQMLQLASKYRGESNWDESTRMARQALKSAGALPGLGTALGRAYLVIADNEHSQGHIPQAQAMLDKAVSAVSKRAGVDSIEHASILVEAALRAQVMNDYVKAETNLRRAIEIRNKTNGPADRELSNDLTMLGNLSLARGRNREAIELYQRAISAAGDDYVALVSPLSQLGILYQNMGRNGEAESTFLRFLHLLEGQFGLESPALTDPLSRLRILYHTMGKTASEEQMQERLQTIQARIKN